MELFENLGKIFNVSLIYATFRASTPIIYAALCAAITQQAYSAIATGCSWR